MRILTNHLLKSPTGLSVKLSVDCAQKTFKAEFSSYKFGLLPADYAPSQSPTGVQEQEMVPAPAYGDSSGSLPSYHDAKLAAK